MAEGYTQYQCASRFSYRYMGDFTQPQQKYAGTGENCNIAIPLIFSSNKNFMKIFVLTIWVCKHSDIKERKNQFCKYVKMSENLVKH